MQESTATLEKPPSAATTRGSSSWLWPALILGGAYLGVLVLRVPARAPFVFYSFLALAFCALAWAASRRVAAAPAGAILGIAIALRVLWIPLPPTLSDDAYRGVWDGRVAAAAHDPYEVAPGDERLAPLRGTLFDRFTHHDVPTASPPLALTLFAIVSRLPGSIWWLKAFLAAVDVLTCVLLLRIASRFELSRRGVLWYAWNPLVTLEVAGMGHVDALGVAAVVAAVWFLSSRPVRVAAAASAAAAGILAKLAPIVALPLWARHSRKPGRFLLWIGILCGVAAAPVLVSAGGLPPGLGRSGVASQFNGPLFEPLWRLLRAMGVAPWLRSGLDLLGGGIGRTGWAALQRFMNAELLARCLLIVPFVAGVLWHWRRDNLLTATGGTFSWLLLASATVCPWHLLWVLPFAALCGQPAWRLLSITILLAYLPLLLHIPAWPWMWMMMWIPFGLALLIQPRWSTG